MMKKVILVRPKEIDFVECQNPVAGSRNLEEWWSKHREQYPNLFNGELLACQQASLDEAGRLTIDWYRTNYAQYRLRTDPTTKLEYARSLYCSVAIGTDDNEVLFGRMASNTGEPGRLQLAGGNIELDGSRCIDIDLCKLNALRELNEEVGIALKKEEIDLWRVKLEGDFGDVGFIFKNNKPISKQKISRLFDAHKASVISSGNLPEFPSLAFIKFGDTHSLANEKVVDYGPNVVMEIGHP